jgi:hypothetical protein
MSPTALLLPLPLRAWAAKSGPRAGVRGPAATSPDPPPPASPGPLRNGNPRGNPCRALAMPDGRSRPHGSACAPAGAPRAVPGVRAA